MNIYFSCSLTGGRGEEDVYAFIVDRLLELGYEVPTEHLARPEVMDLEEIVDPEEVYRRDIEWIENADAIIAEVSTPSHGVGYEIAYGLNIGKPVLCFFSKDAKVSKMITGNCSTGLRLAVYESHDDLTSMMDDFLGTLQ